MVTVDCLAALDHLVWLRTGQRAAEALITTQPTISRNSKKCLSTFALQLRRQGGEWQLSGDCSLLNLERRVHQQLRWQQNGSLRLEAQHWCAPGFASLQAPGWTLGNFNYLEYTRPLELLSQGVIDAWLCSAPDAPTQPELTGLQLNTMPMQLLVRPDHPLLSQGTTLSWDDLLPYPVQPLPAGAFPVFEAVIAGCGLLPCPEREQAMKAAPWYGQRPLEDLLIVFSSPLTQQIYGETLVPLPLTLPIEVGDVLMVRSDYADHPRTRMLTTQLIEHLSPLAAQQRDVVVHQPPRLYASQAATLQTA